MASKLSQAHFDAWNVLDKQGYLILKRQFSPELIQGLLAAFLGDYAAYFANSSPRDALEVGKKRFQITVKVEGVFNNPALYANSFLLEVMSGRLGREMVISDMTCVSSVPGAQAMHIHCDGRIYEELPIANLLPPHAIGLLIPLINFTQENGVTRLWPGTHRQNNAGVDFEANENFVDPELEQGDCLLMDYRLMHRGNANNSDVIRPLLYINYSTPWYFDSNNFIKQAQLLMTDQEFSKVPHEFRPMFARRNLMLASARTLQAAGTDA